MKKPNDCISFADIKNHFFFSYHSSGKTFWQNDDVPIVNLQLFFRRNPPTSWGMKKQMNVQNKTKASEEKNPSWSIRNSFLFWTNKKKVSPYERKFLLVLPLKCWSNIFWLLWGFHSLMRECFFFVCSKQKRISKRPSEVFFFTNFCLVLNIQFFFSCPRGRGDFFWKKIANWRSGHRHFVEIFFQKNDLKKKWFFISAKLMQSFSIFIYWPKVKKKVHFEKSWFSPQPPYFQELPSFTCCDFF